MCSFSFFFLWNSSPKLKSSDILPGVGFFSFPPPHPQTYDLWDIGVAAFLTSNKQLVMNKPACLPINSDRLFLLEGGMVRDGGETPL